MESYMEKGMSSASRTIRISSREKEIASAFGVLLSMLSTFSPGDRSRLIRPRDLMAAPTALA
jgi:hypothetical protein